MFTLGIDYDDRVLPSIVNEVTKAVVVSITFVNVHFKYRSLLCLSESRTEHLSSTEDVFEGGIAT